MLEVSLPTKPVPAAFKSPRRMFIYSAPKSGKTTAVTFLKDYLLIDLEKGSDFLDAVKVKVNSVSEISMLIKALKANPHPYKIGIIDTTTKLEEIVLPYAADLYRATPMGAKWGRLVDGTTDFNANILTLPSGGGYLYLREAFMKVSNALSSCFERMIYLGHLKDKMLEKDGKEVSARDIDLTGKLKNIACANSDAIGFMYREGNQTIISFKASQHGIDGARPEHLRNQAIPVLEYTDGVFKDNWDQIYID